MLFKQKLLSKIPIEKRAFPFSRYVYSAVIINLISLLFVLFVQAFLPPQVPLFYGLPQGEEQLFSPPGLILPAVFSFLAILINYSLINYTKGDFLKKILAAACLATAILSAITTTKIAFLVGQF